MKAIAYNIVKILRINHKTWYHFIEFNTNGFDFIIRWAAIVVGHQILEDEIDQ